MKSRLFTPLSLIVSLAALLALVPGGTVPTAAQPLLPAPGAPALRWGEGEAEGTIRTAPLTQGPLNDRRAVRAAGRGNPWVNLRDGAALPTFYTGAAAFTQALGEGAAQPLGLAAGDFDEDGVPDLVCGYAVASGGILTLHRGNVDAIYPNSAEAQQRREERTFVDAPFLPPARVFEVPVAPDFLGTGDFNNDAHLDVVAAAYGDDALTLLPGNGQGGFGSAQAIPLPGGVTALVTGEVNRRDGLMDLVVGIAPSTGLRQTQPSGSEHGGSEGPQVLVFEGVNGALRREPEAFDVPAEVTGLALGQLDDHYAMDLAVAAGNELLIIHGRDRKLLPDQDQQAGVPSAVVDQHILLFPITALALGDFALEEGYQLELALLAEDGAIHVLDPITSEEITRHTIPSLALASASDLRGERLGTGSVEPSRDATRITHLVRANVSSLPADDLVLVDPANRQIHLVVPVQRGTTQDERGMWNVVQRPWSVPLDVASEPVAVLPMRLNPDALSDLVILQSGSSGPTVVPTAPMATFIVNSAGDPGDGECDAIECTLREAINTAESSPGADAIHFTVPSISPGSELPHIFDPLTIDGTMVGMVELNGVSVGENGLAIKAGSTTVRGLVINRFGGGIYISWMNGGNVIEGNYIGTDVSGGADLGNSSHGLYISSPNNTIGGTTGAARNLISGNNGDAVQIWTDGGNQVQGNYIGTDVNGTADLGNSGNGVFMIGPNHAIGGTTAGARNVISGNDDGGISIGSNTATRGILVQGNYIGVDKNGTAALGNTTHGVHIQGSYGGDHTVGGTAEGMGNTIAYNGGDGVRIVAGIIGNRIRRNRIHDNAGLGIDLGGYGQDRNDFDDRDGGANRQQNWPEISEVMTGSGQLQITFEVDTDPAYATYPLEVEFFIADSPVVTAEGKVYLGSTQYLTVEAQTVVTKAFAPTQMPAVGDPIVATATDAKGNTSEFSLLPASWITGQVSDGHGHGLPQVPVILTTLSSSSTVTVTADASGYYTFTELYDWHYILRTELHPNTDPPIFEVTYGDQIAPIYAEKAIQLQQRGHNVVNLDFSKQREEKYSTNAETKYSTQVDRHLPDVGAIYYHIHQAVRLATEKLGFTPDFQPPVTIRAYSNEYWSYAVFWKGPCTSGEFADVDPVIVMSWQLASDYHEVDRPENREWHEFGHHVMADAFGDMMPEYDVRVAVLSTDVNTTTTVLPVTFAPAFSQTLPLPDFFMIGSGEEYVRCQGRTATQLTGCERGHLESRARPHAAGTAVRSYDLNHGGYRNPSTTDAWDEGFAMFYSMLVANEIAGDSRPEVYRTSEGSYNLEANFKAWTAAIKSDEFFSFEELAVAGLLWDLYDVFDRFDRTGYLYDDFVSVPLTQLWSVLSADYGATIPAPGGNGYLFDVKHLYDVLVAAGVGSGNSDATEDSISDLDEVFIAHGFFNDANGNQSYDAGEEVGRTAYANNPRHSLYNRSTRRSIQLSSWSSVRFSAQDVDSGDPLTVTQFLVDVVFGDRVGFSHSYVYDVTERDPEGILILLADPEYAVTATVRALVPGYVDTHPLVFTNDEYWERIGQGAGDYFMTYTFELRTSSPTYLPLIVRDYTP